MAQPVSSDLKLRKVGLTVLGVETKVHAAVPPPFVAMPLSERPKKAKHKRLPDRKRKKGSGTEALGRRVRPRCPSSPVGGDV